MLNSKLWRKVNPAGLKIAFEGDHMSYAQYEKMTKTFSDTSWENCSMILEDLASVKDDYELDCICLLYTSDAADEP